MIAPVRLIDGGGDALEAELLQAALREPVPQESRAAVARALGLPLAVTSRNAGTTAGKSPSVAPMSHSAAQLAGARLGVVGKFCLFGLIGGWVVFSGSEAWRYRSVESDAPVARVSEVSSPATVIPLAPMPDNLPSTASTPPLARRAPVSARSVAAAAAHKAANALAARAASADRLMAQVRQLDGVRAALRASEPERALRLLDQYSAAFPGAELAQEALLLRTRAERVRADEIRGSQGSARDIEEPR